MDFKDIHSEVKRLAAIAAAWNERGRVEEIERALVLDKLKRLYEEVMFLQKDVNDDNDDVAENEDSQPEVEVELLFGEDSSAEAEPGADESVSGFAAAGVAAVVGAASSVAEKILQKEEQPAVDSAAEAAESPAETAAAAEPVAEPEPEPESVAEPEPESVVVPEPESVTEPAPEPEESAVVAGPAAVGSETAYSPQAAESAPRPQAEPRRFNEQSLFDMEEIPVRRTNRDVLLSLYSDDDEEVPAAPVRPEPQPEAPAPEPEVSQPVVPDFESDPVVPAAGEISDEYEAAAEAPAGEPVEDEDDEEDFNIIEIAEDESDEEEDSDDEEIVFYEESDEDEFGEFDEDDSGYEAAGGDDDTEVDFAPDDEFAGENESGGSAGNEPEPGEDYADGDEEYSEDEEYDFSETVTESEDEAAPAVLGDKMMGSAAPTLGDSFHTARTVENGPVTSLRGSIGLNDKFLIVRTLFGGDMEHYDRTMDELEEFTDLDEALLYLHDNFRWKPDNEGVNMLVGLLMRKLS